MTKRKPKLVEVRHGHPGHVLTERGKHHNTVAYSGDQEDILPDALKDNLSPHAVAAIAAYLQAAIGTNNPDVDKEVNWFREKLMDILCGREDEQAFNRLCEELSL